MDLATKKIETIDASKNFEDIKQVRKAISRNNPQKEAEDRLKGLDEMVRRVLAKYGEAIWGKSLFSKKYQVQGFMPRIEVPRRDSTEQGGRHSDAAWWIIYPSKVDPASVVKGMYVEFVIGTAMLEVGDMNYSPRENQWTKGTFTKSLLMGYEEGLIQGLKEVFWSAPNAFDRS